ncbi:MAG: carbohydrate kinase [Planctomycetaceae bacterium]|nr:carbohydrate kinase [Planctomycetaceae bacterium]
MQPRFRIAGLGEILWDVFPDAAHFGGAPANFSCSAAGVGGELVDVLMISAVGNDVEGDRAIEELRKRNVDTSFVHRNGFPTGQVIVELNQKGEASYRFLENIAWDHLHYDAAMEAMAKTLDAVCFGTLGQRASESEETVHRLINATRPACLKIFDINFRPPYWTPEVVRSTLPLADVLKLNNDEIKVLGRVLELSGSDEEIARQILQRYPLKWLVVTRGADGSLILGKNGERSEVPGKSIAVVDTVGAGDAFTAALTVGLLLNRPLTDIHHRASEVAAWTCTQPGATPKFPASLRW